MGGDIRFGGHAFHFVKVHLLLPAPYINAAQTSQSAHVFYPFTSGAADQDGGAVLLGQVLQPGRQVYRVADDGVVHSPRRAYVA